MLQSQRFMAKRRSKVGNRMGNKKYSRCETWSEDFVKKIKELEKDEILQIRNAHVGDKITRFVVLFPKHFDYLKGLQTARAIGSGLYFQSDVTYNVRCKITRIDKLQFQS